MSRLILLFSILVVSIAGYSNVSATNSDWIKNDIYISDAGDSHLRLCPVYHGNGLAKFYDELYSVKSYGCRLYATNIDFLYGSYISTYGLFGVINPQDGDDLFRPISIEDGRKLSFSDLAKALLEVDSRREDGKRLLRVYDDPASSISPVSKVGGINAAYGITGASQQSYILDWPIETPGISENGRYIMATYWDGISNFLVKINTETKEVKRFMIDHDDSIDYSIVTVSNNGRYTVIEGMVFDTESCAVMHDDYSENCGSRKLILSNIPSISTFNNVDVPDFRFGSDGYNLFSTVFVGDAGVMKPIRAVEYSLVPRLDYLALGDSYSSGEGDIGTKSNGGSYYLPGTADDGKCHISSRSYPYLLRDKWGVSTNSMKSVACSGAKVLPDYYGNLMNYSGQSGQLSDLSENNRVTKQQSALDEFHPGEVPQIEFVKKYRPRVVTLTAGGNDVGFGDIIKYCASPTWQAFTMVDDTYGYAVKGSDLNKMLYSSIDTQYVYNKALISKLKDASPDTRIIMVGYPSFISPKTTVCGLNGGALDSNERRMIDDGIKYMNSMLKQLSADEGMSYVDIENTLEGGRICEGAEYVTGISDIGIDKNKRQYYDETFHPNAAGHERIANRIDKSDVYSENNIPHGEQYVPLAQRLSRGADLIKSGSLIKGELTAVKLAARSFMAVSRVKLTVHSEPTSMGDFNAGNDGSVDVTINTTDLSPGRHLIVASGLNAEGREVDYFQFINVAYSSEDMDGDGLRNEIDRCQYIVRWYDDVSGQNVCESSQVNTSTNIKSVYELLPKNSAQSRIASNEDLVKNSLNQYTTPSVAQDTVNAEGNSIYVKNESSEIYLRAVSIIGIILLGEVICGYIYKKRKNTK